MTVEEFRESEEKNAAVLRNHPRYVQFYAYTYGRHRLDQDDVLLSFGQVPVMIEGLDNYNNTYYVHRRLL